MSAAPLDSVALRADFPALQQEIHGKPLVYLDNAATTHKPRAVRSTNSTAATTPTSTAASTH